jgi:hypothetical protein
MGYLEKAKKYAGPFAPGMGFIGIKNIIDGASRVKDFVSRVSGKSSAVDDASSKLLYGIAKYAAGIGAEAGTYYWTFKGIADIFRGNIGSGLLQIGICAGARCIGYVGLDFKQNADRLAEVSGLEGKVIVNPEIKPSQRKPKYVDRYTDPSPDIDFDLDAEPRDPEPLPGKNWVDGIDDDLGLTLED